MLADRLVLARSHTYDLFSRLYLHGLTPELLPYVLEVPELAAALPRVPQPAGAAITAAFEADRAAADHYQLFGFEVFPFQSVFLDETANLGGAITQAVLDFYRQAGFAPPSSGESPDHIGMHLACLSFLCAAEADALEDGLADQAARMRAWQRRLLYEHLLPWLPVFTQAVIHYGQPFYAALAEMTLDLILEHAAGLGGRPAAPFVLPQPPELLGNQKTGLKQIAAYLVTPAYSGCFLSRAAISRLARQHKIPRGFGARWQLLENTLRAAAGFDALPGVLTDLRAELDQSAAAYQALAAEYPVVVDIAQVWLARLAETQSLLAQMQAAGVHTSHD
ncbi:MAG: molecular chaperone TorD family protein [Anaerolineae bacterium]|nr:molecular chaperone TorD family protein [Anaerolineae bacterium]